MREHHHFFKRRSRWACSLLGATLTLAGCQSAAPPPSRHGATASWTDSWHGVALPGKRSTHYAPSQVDRRWVLHARADRSASVHRSAVHVASAQLGQLSFSWRVDALVHEADVRVAQVEDSAVRVLLAFDGDRRRLSQRNRMVFELMHTLSGEPPPYATLMYVWDAQAPLDTLVINERSDRVRQIVVDSGARHLGRWRHHTRDIRADFRRAFGEEPGALIGIAVMTDTDNTQGVAEAWYGEIRLAGPAGPAGQPQPAAPASLPVAHPE